MRIVFFANSPGEIYSWVRPTVKEIRAMVPEVEIAVVNPPCQWRSGREGAVLDRLPGIDRVIGPLEYLKYIVRPGSIPWLGEKKEGTVIIYMGGENIYPLLLKRRIGAPILAYEYAGRHWTDGIDHIFVSTKQAADELDRLGAKPGRIEIGGDLMLDAVVTELDDARIEWGVGANERVVSLYPGSRPYELKYFTPFLLRTAEILSKEIEGLRFFLSLSPFATLQQLEGYISCFRDEYIEGTTGRVSTRGALPAVYTENGTVVEIIKDHQYDLMKASDLMITIPGTKTMEAAGLGTPMVVIAPLNKAEEIVISGPRGLISMLPIIGKPLKRAIIKKLAARYPYTALPNMRVGRFVVPEVRGIISALQVAEEAMKQLENPEELQRISGELKEIAGAKGAARKIAAAAVEMAGEQHPAGTVPSS